MLMELVLALNLREPDCPNYWVRPDNGKLECLYLNDGAVAKVQPPSGAELFLQEEGSVYFIDRSRLSRRVSIVQFPLVQKLFKPIKGTDQIVYWYKVNCRTGQYSPEAVDVGNGVVRNTTRGMRSPRDSDTTRLVNEVCR